MKLSIFIGRVIWNISRIWDKFKKIYLMSCFQEVGKDCYLGKNIKITPKNIRLGNHVYIGEGSVIQSAHGEIIIGNHVMLGPNVHIHGGNHIFNEIGCYMDEVKSKNEGEDGQVVIEDDVWIGSCSIVLKGVRIGKGSVIGAGAIVTKDVPSYSIYTNKIEPIIRRRFSNEEIIEHERQIAKRDTNKET